MGKLAIIGGGESGVGAALLGKQKGLNPLLSDHSKIKENYKKILSDNQIAYEEGGHKDSSILNADLVVKSPGVPESVPIVEKILKKRIPLISEIEFAARYTDAKLICITGSNGKTTTCSLLHKILLDAGINAGLAGNIGSSFALAVASQKHDIFVLEISSFQLDGMFEFKADIAVLLNISPDHLDRYNNSFQNYTDSKMRIIQNMTPSDQLIYNADDPIVVREIEKRKPKVELFPFSIRKKVNKGSCLTNNKIIVKNQKEEFSMSIRNLALQGKHNTYNSMAAGIAAKLMDVRNQSLKDSLTEFQALPHRMENVTTVGGVQYINDSKSTNVNSSYFALESVNKPIVWIAGGKDKGNDYSSLEKMVASKVKAIVCLGLNNVNLHEKFGKVVPTILDAYSASEAVDMAQRIADPGDVVLLSPACASFDLFENYEDRGQQFKNAVYEL
jgi:UDP-N-acetylmuramoylalanine--D-glutamate ligase